MGYTIQNNKKIEKRRRKKKKLRFQFPLLSEALEAIGVVNRFYEARAGNSKIIQIMDIEEHLEN
jgi:hypothetical protein